MLLGLAVFFMWPAYEHLNGEATVYRMFCMSDRKDDGSCKDQRTSVTETYKAFPDQQSVIVWIGNDAPSKLSNCAVRDALNWRCTNRDKQGGSLDQSMANGELSETVDGGMIRRSIPRAVSSHACRNRPAPAVLGWRTPAPRSAPC